MALLLESLPLGGALTGVALVALVFGLGALSEFGGAVPLPVEVLLSLPAAIAIQAASFMFLAFFLSGVGWIYSGRTLIGLLVMALHGYVSLGVFALGHSTGGSPQKALAYFIASVTMAALSVITLAIATRSTAATRPGAGVH